MDPIIDISKLTKEQREHIHEWWSAVANCYQRKEPPTYHGMRVMFAELFGKDIFKKERWGDDGRALLEKEK